MSIVGEAMLIHAFNSEVLMKKTKSAGFTLIELVMVIVVIGILSVVALPKFTNLSGAAATAAVAANTRAVHAAFAARIFKESALAPSATVSGEIYPSLQSLITGGSQPRVRSYYHVRQDGGGEIVGDTPREVCTAIAEVLRIRAESVEVFPSSPWYECRYDGNSGGHGTLLVQVDYDYSNAQGASALSKPLPIALDGSGICVGKGFRLPSWTNHERTAPTISPDSQIYALTDQAVEDAEQCPGD